MSANATLAECCELIDEMRTIYSSSDDAVAVKEARAAFGGLRAALDQRQGCLAASIRGACPVSVFVRPRPSSLAPAE
jgi:hypothetical protein